ncbi:MAG: aryl-sulfate sulfotransferase [Proteobacteria bacterium]|nr:aryl-sulfate sulfotransferase [Pseudomonadota bacterium]
MSNIRISYSFHSISLIALTLVCTTFFGCDDDSSEPVVTAATIEANPDNALSATIEVRTDVPTKLEVEVVGEGHSSWQIPLSAQLATSHSIPVLGLRSETKYNFVITATDRGGNTVEDESLTVTSAALPADFPAITASLAMPLQVAAGFTIFSVIRIDPKAGPLLNSDWGMMIAVDAEGHVVWYQNKPGGGDLSQLDNGNFLYMNGHSQIIEMDAMGNTVNTITAADVGIDGFHHEIIALPSGNFLTLSTDLRTISGYKDEAGDPVLSYQVVGDVIVEFSASGEIVHQVNMFDVLDPLRIIEPDFHFNFYDGLYGVTGSKDWTHGNAVVMHPDGDAYVISLRHQDWLVKVDRETGQLVWRLGVDGDFAMPGGNTDFAYHHHAPEFQQDGSLLLYDNGNGRPVEAGQEPYSRVVHYELDEENMVLTRVWQYRGSEDFFTPTVGDADRLANGNVLVTQGSLTDDPTQVISAGTHGRIVEVTDDASPATVFEVEINDPPGATQDYGYMVYRAERIESLYPNL